MIACNRRSFLTSMIAAPAAAALPAATAHAAPAAELWPRWQAHDPDSQARIDHGRWAEFLPKYVIEQDDTANLVDYAAVSKPDRENLRRYIDDLTAIEISKYNRDEQFAYWTNLYNALTIEVVLEHWPVDSIRDINLGGGGLFSGLFGGGPWKAKLIQVEGEELGLDDIEHRIMRPIWKDPRIHYIVNCASIGCPDLWSEPYEADRLEEQMEAAARNYVNCPRGAEVDNGGLTVSKIFTWYQEDFGNSDQGVIDHLKVYAEPELKARLDEVGHISSDRYDWAINAPEDTRES